VKGLQAQAYFFDHVPGLLSRMSQPLHEKADKLTEPKPVKMADTLKPASLINDGHSLSDCNNLCGFSAKKPG
jgi:hypothetical protein